MHQSCTNRCGMYSGFCQNISSSTGHVHVPWVHRVHVPNQPLTLCSAAVMCNVVMVCCADVLQAGALRSPA